MPELVHVAGALLPDSALRNIQDTNPLQYQNRDRFTIFRRIGYLELPWTDICATSKMSELTEREKMMRGELFRAFTPDLVAARARCKYACNRFNNTTDELPRRRLVELWRE